jgi:hypothetical protein
MCKTPRPSAGSLILLPPDGLRRPPSASDDYGTPLHPAFMTEIFNF